MNAQQLLQLPPVKWDAAVSAITAEDQARLEDELLAIAQAATRAAGYVKGMRRRNMHLEGVRVGNQMVSALRKAFGFSYPGANDIYF